jgi:hypothetical protein
MVSHAVSQIFFTTIVNKKLDTKNVMRFHHITGQLFVGTLILTLEKKSTAYDIIKRVIHIQEHYRKSILQTLE